jgi:hypothetical protein
MTKNMTLLLALPLLSIACQKKENPDSGFSQRTPLGTAEAYDFSSFKTFLISSIREAEKHVEETDEITFTFKGYPLQPADFDSNLDYLKDIVRYTQLVDNQTADTQPADNQLVDNQIPDTQPADLLEGFEWNHYYTAAHYITLAIEAFYYKLSFPQYTFLAQYRDNLILDNEALNESCLNTWHTNPSSFYTALYQEIIFLKYFFDFSDEQLADHLIERGEFLDLNLSRCFTFYATRDSSSPLQNLSPLFPLLL